MSVTAAYCAVVLIWSTTPLAIKWSGEGGGFLFGVTGRIVLSALVALGTMVVLRIRLPLHRRARTAYLVAGANIYASMMCVYWGAQRIPSGWISVLFGLSPLMTGVMAVAWLDDRRLGPLKIVGIAVAIIGLAVMFGTGIAMNTGSFLGIMAVVLAAVFHSANAVWLKRLGAGLQGISVTTGGLLVAAPMFLFTWFVADARWPTLLGQRALSSIVYLSVFGSVVGWTLFFFVLKNVPVVRVALITLITPVVALFLGNRLNGESLEWRVWLGSGLILIGLFLFELAERWQARLLVPTAEVEVRS